jgi:hypothetical protein
MKCAFGIFLILLMQLTTFAAWDSPDNGNPLLPGYTADPSIIYDSASATFYIYSTSDGVWISYSADPQVAYSKDFINWKFRPIELPDFWPDRQLWAPSAMRHPTNGKFYLMYCMGSSVHIAWADSGFGPWNNAVANDGVLYRSGELTGGSDWIDPQFFIDTNTVYFTFGQSSNMGVAKLAFDPSTHLVTVDGSDSRMTDGVKYKCKRLAGLSNNLEGSCMFKNDGRYFITYSNSACQNYNVRYAVASSPVGPFTYVNRIIVQRDNANNILGPGHNSILRYENDWYICYHRQHYQYIDVKRQTCIDRITISGDDISTGSQTQKGVWAGEGALESLVAESRANRETDLAFGKMVLASSESAFKGGTSQNQKENFAEINGFYKARYAVDRNNGTRWAPSSLPGYLIVDLEDDCNLGRCETTFELVMRAYQYRIEYLAQSDAEDISAARNSSAWKIYADRSNNRDNVSPVVDSNTVTARYLKLTLLSGDIPTENAQISTILQTDYADRLSVFEFKAFERPTTGCKAQPVQPPKRKSGMLTYTMHRKGRVEVVVVSCGGRVVHRHSEMKPCGTFLLRLQDYGIPAGVYVVSIGLPDEKTERMVCLTR